MQARRRTLTTFLGAVLLALAASPAGAQQVDPHYAEGVAAFGAGDFAKAITEMNASMANRPTSKAALYLGNAHLKLGQLGIAKASLERALELDPKNPKRAAIQKLIKGIEVAQTAKVSVSSVPPGATITVDSDSSADALGKTPFDVKLTPGSHEIVVALEGYETEKRSQEFKTGEKVAIEVTLKPVGCDVALSALPAAARATLDGGEPLTLPAKARVGLGAHKVAFAATGFVPQELAVDCDGTGPLTLAPTLAAVVLTGRVTFPAARGVTVAIDGRTLSAEEQAQGVVLPVGPHEIVFTTPGSASAPVRKSVVVAASQELFVAPPASAAPPPPPPSAPGFPARGLYVGAVGGAHVPLVEWNVGGDARGADSKASGTAGVRVGVQLAPRLAVEGEALWVGLPNRKDDGLGHGLTADGNVLFHVLRGRWTPVLEAGAGTYQVLSSALGADADLRLHAGLGLRGALGNGLVVRVDARNVVTDGFEKSIGDNVELLLGVETFLWKTK